MSSDIEHEPWRTVEYGNLALVRAVKKRPCLYNNTLPEYSQKDVTRAAWEEIAEEFGCSVASCKKRWMRMRSALSKDLLKRRRKGKEKPHFLAEHLDFILPFRMKDQQNSINKCLQDNISEKLQETIEVMPESRAQIDSNNPEHNIDGVLLVHNELEREIAELKNNGMAESVSTFAVIESASYNSFENSTRKQYILSLQPEVDELTETQFRSFKRKILRLIDDVKHV